MKNLKKILAVMTSVAAICTSMTAFAADASTSFTPNGVADVFSFTYANDTGVISNVTFGDNVKDGDVTILVTDGTERQNVGESNILYIDQSTKTAGFNASMGLLKNITFTTEEMAKTEATTKEIPVYLGYTSDDGFAIADGNITATYTPATQETTVTVLWGDVNLNGTANMADAAVTAAASLGGKSTFEKDGYTFTWNSNEVTDSKGNSYTIKGNVIWGDVNLNGTANMADAAVTASASLGGKKEFSSNGTSFVWGDSSNQATLTLIKK